MATVTTKKEQTAAATAARKVGGYGELVRLSAERTKKGANSVLSRDTKTGHWAVKRQG